ncbi:MAG TPA: LytTR family transcriptional regulator DNA-binding domain-containing protein [Rhodanobacteraceae bacterium]|nr:LytTR family transcriptional regulator DNA-binding domain-containing protein [Rhodanobacteraceae bacterium]
MSTQTIRALLVDDEVLARLALRQALETHPDVTIVGECGNAADALQAMAVLQPDLLFLDIRMPGMDGFKLLHEITPGVVPMVVFATAFSQHAVRAFDAEALDYLLKPIDQTRFDRTMHRVRQRWHDLQASMAAPRPIPADSGPLQRLSVQVGEHVRVIAVEAIDWIRADGNYVQIRAEGAQFLHRATMQSLQDRLDPTRFLRIHRGVIVNVDRVHEVHPLFNGNAEVVLRDGTRLALSRRFRAGARALLGLR